MMHWLVVLLMIGTYAFIELRVLFPKGEPMRDIFKDIHYWLGLLVLILIFPRIWSIFKTTDGFKAGCCPMSNRITDFYFFGTFDS